MAGYASAAIEVLTRAISLDELSRVRSRTDSNFAEIVAVSEYQVLLNTDSYTPPDSAYVASRTFDVPYRGADGGLFGAVMTSTFFTLDVQINSATFRVIFWPDSTMISPSRCWNQIGRTLPNPFKISATDCPA